MIYTCYLCGLGFRDNILDVMVNRHPELVRDEEFFKSLVCNSCADTVFFCLSSSSNKNKHSDTDTHVSRETVG